MSTEGLRPAPSASSAEKGGGYHHEGSYNLPDYWIDTSQGTPPDLSVYELDPDLGPGTVRLWKKNTGRQETDIIDPNTELTPIEIADILD